MPIAEEFFDALEFELGGPLDTEARAYVSPEHPSAYADATDDEERQQVVVRSADVIQAYRDGRGEPSRIHTPLPKDRRWQLLRDLDHRFHALFVGPEQEPWEPLSVVGERIDPNREPLARRVTISFDSRLSQQALIAEIRRMWPRLTRSRLVRRTRPLSDRSDALIRYVCLDEEPDRSWQDRLESWNQKHDRWQFAGVPQFERAFRRAEEQLTGEKFGLEWFYASIARIPFEEVVDRFESGDAEARRYLRYRAPNQRSFFETRTYRRYTVDVAREEWMESEGTGETRERDFAEALPQMIPHIGALTRLRLRLGAKHPLVLQMDREAGGTGLVFDPEGSQSPSGDSEEGERDDEASRES